MNMTLDYWKLPHLVFLLATIGVFIYGVGVTVLRRPHNGLMYMLCGAGLMLCVAARELFFLGLRSSLLLTLLVVSGELAIAVGIFSIRLEPSEDQTRRFRSLSSLGRLNLLASLGLIALLIVMGLVAISQGGLLARTITPRTLLMLMGMIPIVIALVYKAVRRVLLR